MIGHPETGRVESASVASTAPGPPWLAWLYNGFAIVVLFVMLGAMFGGHTEVLYGTIAAAIAGAVALGVLSVQRGWIAPKSGARLFVKPWLWMTAFAALSLFNGKWEPMVFFGALAASTTFLYWLGTMVGCRFKE
jgi:hypothetical protein